MSLEEKIADYIYSNQQAIFYGTTVDSASVQAEYVISLIDGEYSGMDAESNCTCVCHKKTNSEEWRKENEPYCRLCNGTGTIRRKLSNKELAEVPKMILEHTASVIYRDTFAAHLEEIICDIFLPSGERIVKGEK